MDYSYAFFWLLLIVLLDSGLSDSVHRTATGRPKENNENTSTSSDHPGDDDDDDDDDAPIRLPTFLASSMVLQRAPLRARLWGWAVEPNRTISVTLVHRSVSSTGTASQHYVTTTKAPAEHDSTDTSHNNNKVKASSPWSLSLDPQPAGTNFTIVIALSDDQNSKNDTGSYTVTLEDIAFGDVYWCAGQSNMEFTVSQSFHAPEEIAGAIHYPHLRLATVAKVTASTPQTDASSKTANYVWARSSPSTVDVGNGDWGVYSATCYYFGRSLYQHINHDNDSTSTVIPIGLVTSSWGGQRVEAFSSQDALLDDTCGGSRPLQSALQRNSSSIIAKNTRVLGSVKRNSSRLGNEAVVNPSTAAKTDGTIRGRRPDGAYLRGQYQGPQPMELWNAMIYPLLPMRFSGIVWYQGEANANDPTSYSCRFPAMISDWRRKIGLDDDLPFLYVELAGFARGKNWPETRAAQAAALQLPNVGMATAIDLSDPSSPDGSIHPRRKQEVGRRLSLQVRSLKYRERDIVTTGPKLANVEYLPRNATESSSSLILLGFVPRTADGLHFHGTGACDTCCDEPPFQAMDEAGVWRRVERATVVRNKWVILKTSIRHGMKILGIRYAWEPRPQCALYNGKGGPDDHTALAGAPFEWCFHPDHTKGSWSGKGCATTGLSMTRSLGH